MTRFTTPTYTLKLAGFEDLSSHINQVTISQDFHKLVIEDDDLLKDGNKIMVLLSQEQSGQFKAGTAYIQVRGLMEDGTAYASNIATVTVNNVLNGGVLA